MKTVRQNSGIDMAKDKFDAGFTTIDDQQNIKHRGIKMFNNTPQGFEEFYNWCKKHQQKDILMHFTMEATGVYYESLAYFLIEKGENVSVLLPNTVKKFGESLNIKSKTDKIDAKILGQMGVERKLPIWNATSLIYRDLKTLTRHRQNLVEMRTMVKNQLHAENHTAHPHGPTITRMKNHIKYMNKQIDRIEKELEKRVKKDEEVSEKIKKNTTIPGIGFLTVVTVIAETQGFTNFTSLRQLSSFAGYDIQLRESGKLKGKTRISKKGNSHIRRAMYMPSIGAKRYSKTYSKFYERLNERKQNGLITGTAVQRKLLGLMYTLWKNDTVYIDNYEQERLKLSI
ncbi:MAG: IS110 family transposase [Bacteroidota bacterium]|nr:IS110 family transposase [Bacteroidota bacterium]